MKADHYRAKLRTLADWDDYLLAQSGLPGPRANLELIQAVVDEGNAALFRRYLTLTPDKAPTDSPHVFLAVCGIVGLGRLLAEGQAGALNDLRRYASDPRWRAREAVAMALQRLGDHNMGALLRAMDSWSKGSPLEQRAAVAALCEPRLLREAKYARRALRILDRITLSVSRASDRKSEDFKILRKTLGYGWSVAVAALPAAGKRMIEKWFGSDDKDVIWILRENLKKNRLLKMDTRWTRTWRKRLSSHKLVTVPASRQFALLRAPL